MTDEKRTKSKYAKKLARKRGKGRIDPNWMWWFERNTDLERQLATK